MEGRHLFFRAGSSVFLVFDPRATNTGGPLPSHGAEGAGHVCFLAGGDAYELWKEHLASHGVEVDQEIRWGEDKLSFYFRDPAGNLLEIANTDFWG